MEAGGLSQGLQHGRTNVDGVDANVGISREKTRGEAAIAIAKNQSAAATRELGKKMRATALKRGAEGEVFEPAVRPREAVEIRRGIHDLRSRSFISLSTSPSTSPKMT